MPQCEVDAAKFHELSILLMFVPGLQIIIYLSILASKARNSNVMDIAGAAAFGQGPYDVDKISMSGLGDQNHEIYNDLESRPNISNIGSS